LVSTTLRPLYPIRDQVPIVEVAGLHSVPVWAGTENFVPTEKEIVSSVRRILETLH